MAKLSSIYFFFFLFLLPSQFGHSFIHKPSLSIFQKRKEEDVVAVAVIPRANAGTCQLKLFKDGCDPLACREQCTHQYNGNGACTDNGTALQD
ncbi:hypothetical protein IFM89_011063 [Coptis chinensis]|uniref:Uncharacterized protein n=1 Tax=Coptis chinensis TaxID=261450 RepID=A0A835IPB3_9MAGN|nr:hypothetical protein IFM89_011063 [Coptis chinensis]